MSINADSGITLAKSQEIVDYSPPLTRSKARALAAKENTSSISEKVTASLKQSMDARKRKRCKVSKLPLGGISNIVLSAEEAAMAGAPQGPLIKVSVLTSDCFKASADPEAELKLVTTLIGTALKKEDWAAQFAALNTIRSLCLFHPEMLKSHMGPVASFVHSSVRSLRSSMARNAMHCVRDMYTAGVVPLLDSSILTESVQCLITHCGSKQNFMAAIATEMVEGMLLLVPLELLMPTLCTAAEMKNAAAAGQAMVFVEKCLAKLGVGKQPGAGLPSSLVESDLGCVLVAAVCGSEGKHEAGRAASKKCLRRFRRAMGQGDFEKYAKAALPVQQFYTAMKHSAKPIPKGRTSMSKRAAFTKKLSIRERLKQLPE